MDLTRSDPTAMAYYTHASMYRFTPTAAKEVYQRLYHLADGELINTDEVRPHYDDHDDIFNLSCRQTDGPKLKRILDEAIAAYLKEQGVYDGIDENANVQPFAGSKFEDMFDLACTFYDEPADSPTQTTNNLHVKSKRLPCLHIVPLRKGEHPEVKLLRITELPRSLHNHAVRLYKHSGAHKSSPNDCIIAAVQWDEDTHQYTYVGRTRELLPAYDPQTLDTLLADTIFNMLPGPIEKEQKKHVKTGHQWEFVGPKPTVEQWLAGMGKTVQVSPDVAPEVTNDALKFTAGPTVHQPALGRVRVAKGSALVTSLQSDDAGSAAHVHKTEAELVQQFAALASRDVNLDSESSDSESEASQETEEAVSFGNLLKSGPTSSIENKPPNNQKANNLTTLAITPQSLDPTASSDLESNRSSDLNEDLQVSFHDLLAAPGGPALARTLPRSTVLSRKISQDACRPGPELKAPSTKKSLASSKSLARIATEDSIDDNFPVYGSTWAKVDTTGLAGRAEAQARWEVETCTTSDPDYRKGSSKGRILTPSTTTATPSTYESTVLGGSEPWAKKLVPTSFSHYSAILVDVRPNDTQEFPPLRTRTPPGFSSSARHTHRQSSPESGSRTPRAVSQVPTGILIDLSDDDNDDGENNALQFDHLLPHRPDRTSVSKSPLSQPDAIEDNEGSIQERLRASSPDEWLKTHRSILQKPKKKGKGAAQQGPQKSVSAAQKGLPLPPPPPRPQQNIKPTAQPSRPQKPTNPSAPTPTKPQVPSNRPNNEATVPLQAQTNESTPRQGSEYLIPFLLDLEDGGFTGVRVSFGRCILNSAEHTDTVASSSLSAMEYALNDSGNDDSTQGYKFLPQNLIPTEAAYLADIPGKIGRATQNSADLGLVRRTTFTIGLITYDGTIGSSWLLDITKDSSATTVKRGTTTTGIYVIHYPSHVWDACIAVNTDPPPSTVPDSLRLALLRFIDSLSWKMLTPSQKLLEGTIPMIDDSTFLEIYSLEIKVSAVQNLRQSLNNSHVLPDSALIEWRIEHIWDLTVRNDSNEPSRFMAEASMEEQMKADGRERWQASLVMQKGNNHMSMPGADRNALVEDVCHITGDIVACMNCVGFEGLEMMDENQKRKGKRPAKQVEPAPFW